MTDNVYIYPTDTVWGLGGNIFSEIAQTKIARLKQTAPNKSLSILFPDIEKVADYFNLPAQVSNKWLEQLFKLEASLGIPTDWSKIQIPHWVVHSSPIILIRIINLPVVREIYAQEGAPITSTSLNRSGEPAMVDREAAKYFSSMHRECIFKDDKSASLSGLSSTILKLDENFKVTVIRQGSKILEILEHAKRLSST